MILKLLCWNDRPLGWKTCNFDKKEKPFTNNLFIPECPKFVSSQTNDLWIILFWLPLKFLMSDHNDLTIIYSGKYWEKLSFQFFCLPKVIPSSFVNYFEKIILIYNLRSILYQKNKISQLNHKIFFLLIISGLWNIQDLC